MFKNYLKTAIRSLARNRSYSILNMAGLAAGIAICLAIFIIIRFESSFDNFHSKKDRIYRVLTEYHHADAANIFYGNGVPRPLPSALRNNFPQVAKVTTIYTEGNDQLLVMGDNGQPIRKFKEEKGVFFLEPSFFDIFDFPWLAGNPTTALKQPNSVVLTKETAEKYFGDWKQSIGKTLKWNNRGLLKVTGVLATIPENSDFQLKVVISYGTDYTAEFAQSTNWDGTGTSFGCYVLLMPNSSPAQINSELGKLSRKMKSADNKDSQVIQALSQVHYDTQAGNYSGKSMSRKLISVLWLIAGFILLIACTNFINLSTALAVNRSREVGVRKVLGSNKRQLVTQFIMETLLIVITSVAFAIGIAALALPLIGKILNIPVVLNVLQQPEIILFLLVLTVVVTALAGFYPSLVLSGFNPINALNSQRSMKSKKGVTLRRGLVVFQFVIAQALIIGTLVMVKQMNYFISRPLGFDKEAIVNVPFPSDSAGISKLDYLRKKLLSTPGIQNVSFSSNTPVEDDNDNWTTFKFNRAAKETDFYAINKWTDEQYLPTYQLPLVAGRNLEPSDTVREFLVNELLVKNLGFKNAEEVLNKEIDLWDGRIKGTIVGVLKEFNTRSFRRDLAPVIMSTLKGGYSQAGIKLTSANILTAMKSVESLWQEIFPDFVYEYQFLDDKVASFYAQESRLSHLYKIFAAIAILLSCLGLYGLASFMAVQRIKEVGIRKVLGASSGSIVYLFSKEFILLIAIAFVVASPIAWYFMHKWLQDYPFRINISWWIFIAGGLASVVIALITVSFQAIRAAITNPVKTLRTE